MHSIYTGSRFYFSEVSSEYIDTVKLRSDELAKEIAMTLVKTTAKIEFETLKRKIALLTLTPPLDWSLIKKLPSDRPPFPEELALRGASLSLKMTVRSAHKAMRCFALSGLSANWIEAMEALNAYCLGDLSQALHHTRTAIEQGCPFPEIHNLHLLLKKIEAEYHTAQLPQTQFELQSIESSIDTIPTLKAEYAHECFKAGLQEIALSVWRSIEKRERTLLDRRLMVEALFHLDQKEELFRKLTDLFESGHRKRDSDFAPWFSRIAYAIQLANPSCVQAGIFNANVYLLPYGNKPPQWEKANALFNQIKHNYPKALPVYLGSSHALAKMKDLTNAELQLKTALELLSPALPLRCKYYAQAVMEKRKLLIRPLCHLGDISWIERLVNERLSFRDDPNAMKGAFLTQAVANNGYNSDGLNDYFYFALQSPLSRNPAGFILYSINSKEAAIRVLGVRKKHQKNKIGTLLLGLAMEHALSRDCQTIHAFSTTEETMFYPSMGFKLKINTRKQQIGFSAQENLSWLQEDGKITYSYKFYTSAKTKAIVTERIVSALNYAPPKPTAAIPIHGDKTR